jgi:hypothetical protein
VIADCAAETMCLACGQADGNVKRIRDTRQPGSQSETLHEVCAAKWFDGEGDAATIASVPFMITSAMKERLRARGLSDDAIANLTPARAHEILADDEPILWS